MCLDKQHRDGLPSLQELSRRRTLVQREATKGDEVRSDIYIRGSNRPYFRRKTFSTLVGPMDTTEIIMKAGTVVEFSEISDAARKQYGLKRARPRARVVTQGNMTGFCFGKSGKNPFFPLETNEYVEFKILSLPRPNRRATINAIL